MAIWDRYTSKTTSFETRSYIGPAFYVRSFCDDPSGTTYLSKPPVCKLKLTPRTQFANTDIAWDISGSTSATGTIDTFDITWGGTTDIGDLASQAWATDPTDGDVQYTTVGTYTATATVTDTLGKESAPCKVEVNIVTREQRLYIGTVDGGCFILTPTDLPAAANTGLTGGHVYFRALHVHPAYSDLPVTQHHLWAATEDGVAYTTDGATNWTVIARADLGTPENAAGDDHAPVTADLDQIDLCFDPNDPQVVYLLRTTSTRVWVYKTADYGATWTNEQVSL